MSKISSVCFAIVIMFFVASGINAQTITLQDIAKNVPYPTQGVKIVKETPIGGGIYQIVFSMPKDQGLPYNILYGNKDFIIMGSWFKNKQSVTQITLKNYMQSYYDAKLKLAGAYIKSHIDELNGVSVALYTPKKSNGQIMFVFTDIQNPACTLAKKHFIQIANQTHYTLKLIPMANEKQSIQYWNGFICGHHTFQDYIDGNYKPMNDCQSTMNYVGNASNIAQQMGVFTTPTFITFSGKVIVGYDLAKFADIK